MSDACLLPKEQGNLAAWGRELRDRGPSRLTDYRAGGATAKVGKGEFVKRSHARS